MSPIMYSFLFALSLGSLVMALASTTAKSSATASPTPVYSISQVSEFDNIEGDPAVAAGTVGSNSIYENLKWNGFSLSETEAPNTQGLPGIAPQSAPNFIAFAQGDTQTIDEGTPTITVNYEDSSISSFNLETMYYACTLATEASLTSVPTSCNMTVTGFGPPSSGSKQLATQTFPFVSNGGLEQDMTEGVFLSTFQGLYSAVFTLSSADTALTAGLVDNVGNMIFSSSPVVVN